MLFSVDSFFLLRRQYDLFSFTSKMRHIVAKVSLSIFFKEIFAKKQKGRTVSYRDSRLSARRADRRLVNNTCCCVHSHQPRKSNSHQYSCSASSVARSADRIRRQLFIMVSDSW
jgi:hypothetical protein